MVDYVIFGFGLFVTVVVGFGLTTMIIAHNRAIEIAAAESKIDAKAEQDQAS